MDIWGNGHLGPMSIGASGHWEQIGTWGIWTPGKINVRANGHL